MAAQAADVFVSYKAEDRARVLPLVSALQSEGFVVWWDTQIAGGGHWREEIQGHLDAAKCVIVVWTKRSIGHDGNFVRDEASRAQRRGVYLPIRLDPVEPPLGFGEIQAISLKGWHGDGLDPRFLALADVVRRCITGEHVARVSTHQGKTGVSRRMVVASGLGISGIAVASVGGWLLLKPARVNSRRIAVMAFDNLSGDPKQAYFVEGVAEELRSALTRIGLQVIGRASCDAVKNLDINTAASKLGVANILTGSVRRSTDVIRIDAQLVDGSNGVEVWAQSYDRTPGDAIKIQTDIAENVAHVLSMALGKTDRAALTLGGTTDSIAQDLVLQSRKLGRESTTADSLRRRVALTHAAIARDPNYADAYIENAIALFFLAENYSATPASMAAQLAQADASARKAATLTPSLGSAHQAVAFISLGRLDFQNALRETKRSLELSPDDPNVIQSAGRVFAWFESPQQGLQLIERAIALDPLNGRSYEIKTEILTLSRRYADAIQSGRKALELAPELQSVHNWLGYDFLLLGQTNNAKSEFNANPADDSLQLTGLALVAARTGDNIGARRAMIQLRQQHAGLSNCLFADFDAQVGDVDHAFTDLENAIAVQDASLVYLKTDVLLDPIRSDPRYAVLLKKLRFP